MRCASASSSITNLCHDFCGVIGAVMTASEDPFEFEATMLNE